MLFNLKACFVNVPINFSYSFDQFSRLEDKILIIFEREKERNIQKAKNQHPSLHCIKYHVGTWIICAEEDKDEEIDKVEEEGVTIEDASGEFLHKGHVAFIFFFFWSLYFFLVIYVAFILSHSSIQRA